MEYKWLNRAGNKNLIVFFNGWGMEDSVIRHLEYKNFDVLMFYDYNSLKTDFDFETLNKYSVKYLIAWSMGVMVATLFKDINYDKKIAINGTLNPIDDKFGIPKKIYNLTIRKFSPDGARKFMKNMYCDSDLEQHGTELESNFQSRTFENIKSELTALNNYDASINFKYDKIIISTDDKIIPTKNQVAFWKIPPNIKSGHAPFYSYKSWSEIV